MLIFLHGAGGREDLPENVKGFGCFAAARQYTLTARADALFTLTLPTPRPVGEYIRRRPIITE